MCLSMSMIVFHPLTHLMLFSKLSVDHIAQVCQFMFWSQFLQGYYLLAARGH